MTTVPSSTLQTSSIASLHLLARGKGRGDYTVGTDRLLMVASDRVSAFDVILGEPIPGKGALLTQMALVWFGRVSHICPNILTGEAPEGTVTAAEIPQVASRSMLAKRLKLIPIEAVGARLSGRQRLARIPAKSVGLRRSVASGAEERQPVARTDLHPSGQGGGA